jgi:fructokinase
VIVVGGEAIVDLIEDGDHRLRAVPGGGPFNTAVALGRLGLRVAFVGTLSRDCYGTLLGELLADAGVDTSLVRSSDAPTPLAIVHRVDGTAATYTFYLTGTSLTDLPQDALPGLPEDAIALHVGTLGLAVDPPAGAFEALLVREARRRAIVLDPNVRPSVFGDQASFRERFERLAGLAAIVKLSDGDAAWIYPGLEPAAAMEHVLALGPDLVAMTLGPHGAVAAASDARASVPAVPVDLVDTIGAGDTFGAALLAALVEQDALKPNATLNHAVLERTLLFAATAAAITCTRTGAVPPSRDDIDKRLASVSLS